MRKSRLPGFCWRVLAHRRKNGVYGEHLAWEFDGSEGVEFDELVVGTWFHMEQMGDRDWWMRIGDDDEGGVTVNVHIPAKGAPRVMVEKEG